jgi:peptidoglycan/xylan/chitin deacetylase (PgdA/CDA1 family)
MPQIMPARLFEYSRHRRLTFFKSFLFVVLQAATCVGQDTGVPILVYHQITDERPPAIDVISLAAFTEQMELMAREGWRTISIDQLRRFMAGTEKIHPRSFVLTFDDGWKSELRAVPVLRRLGFHAVFFIITGLGIGDPYLDWDEIRTLKQMGFELASHSVSHPWNGESLTTWADGRTPGKSFSDVRIELQQSKHTLERELGIPITSFAWPVGAYNDELVRAAQEEGYRMLFTIDPGANKPGGDKLRVKRLMIDGRCNVALFKESLKDFKLRLCQR